MIAFRLAATIALAADLLTTLRIVRTEGNPILRWLANRVCWYDFKPGWCRWARSLWWAYWVAWVVAVWLVPWGWFAPVVLVVEAFAVCWNVYRHLTWKG